MHTGRHSSRQSSIQAFRQGRQGGGQVFRLSGRQGRAGQEVRQAGKAGRQAVR